MKLHTFVCFFVFCLSLTFGNFFFKKWRDSFSINSEEYQKINISWKGLLFKLSSYSKYKKKQLQCLHPTLVADPILVQCLYPSVKLSWFLIIFIYFRLLVSTWTELEFIFEMRCTVWYVMKKGIPSKKKTKQKRSNENGYSTNIYSPFSSCFVWNGWQIFSSNFKTLPSVLMHETLNSVSRVQRGCSLFYQS